MTPYERGYTTAMKCAGIWGEIGHTLTSPLRLMGNLGEQATLRGVHRAMSPEDLARSADDVVARTPEVAQALRKTHNMGPDESFGTVGDMYQRNIQDLNKRTAGNALRAGALGATAIGAKAMYDKGKEPAAFPLNGSAWQYAQY